MDDSVRLYECIVLYPCGLPQKEEDDILSEVEQLFKEASGTRIAKDVWGRRGLAYSIRSHTEGNFVVYHYHVDPAKIEELNSSLRILRGILRHLIVKPPKGYKILPYAQRFTEWLKERETEEEQRVRSREETFKKKVAEKARKQVRHDRDIEQARSPAPALEGEKLTEELKKILSDEDITL
ncbi:30S ribosomal protein S6 [Candidatus Peribacteria bacterium RIFCSPHIGHO2_01_FULL_51_9]|nr:MAG: 30S ribosomal protein S6 [Candidatus Peribacteria bacterium RIFCSPHIGHO2_01_FULL_51_9]